MTLKSSNFIFPNVMGKYMYFYNEYICVYIRKYKCMRLNE